MEKFTAFIEKHIAPMANKLGRNKYVVALQNSFFAMIPFITVGALALVLISPPADYTTMDPGVARSLMQGWQAFADFTGPTFNFINMVTMNLLAFWIALGMGLNLAKHHKMTPAMPILVTTMSFLIWATMNPDGSLTFDYLGGTGLFVALVASILSFELYRTLTEKKVGHIDLSGAGVPPALADSLGNLLPVVIIFLIFGVSGQIIMSITGAPLPELITILMSPLLGLVDSIGGIIFLAVLVMILWWFGIHDSVITGPLDVFLMSNYSANMAAFAAGTAALGLAVLAATSKSKQIRTVGRLGLIPAIFNINEPLIFGLPIMYNPTLLIPFVVAMPLNGVITYICMATGIVSKSFAYGGWNMPAPIAAFIATLDVKAFILAIALIIIDALVYLPFFKVYEKQKLAEETAVPTEE